MIKLVNLYKEHKLIKNSLNKRLERLHKSSSYIQNSDVKELEEKLSRFKNTKFCITCASGTDALILSLKALNLKHNSEIIIPSYSWISSASSVLLNNYKIKFVDVSLKNACADIENIKLNISKRTKAIILVDLYGNSIESNILKNICKKNNISLIIDGAQSLGSVNNNDYFDVYTTSFFPAKSLGCYGDGGACFTNNSAIASKIALLKKNGQKDRYDAAEVGLNSRLDSIQAAVLLEKLKYYRKFIENRSTLARNYVSGLKKISPNIKSILDLNQDINVCTNFPILIKNRDSFIRYMKEKGIEIGKNYPKPLTSQKAFKKFNNNKKFPNSNYLAKHVATLPLNPFITKKELGIVLTYINHFINSKKRN